MRCWLFCRGPAVYLVVYRRGTPPNAPHLFILALHLKVMMRETPSGVLLALCAVAARRYLSLESQLDSADERIHRFRRDAKTGARRPQRGLARCRHCAGPTPHRRPAPRDAIHLGRRAVKELVLDERFQPLFLRASRPRESSTRAVGFGGVPTSIFRSQSLGSARHAP